MFEGFQYCHFWEVQFQVIGIFQIFCLVCKLFKYDLQIRNLILNVSRYSTGYFALSYKEKSISTGSHLFSYFQLVNKLHELNAFKLPSIFRHFQKLKHYFYLRLFNVFSFKESSILTIKYNFSFFWSLNCTNLVCMFCFSIWTILGFWAVLILEIF